MTTKVLLNEFYTAVKQGEKARADKSPMPILTGVMISRVNQHLEVVSTDLEKAERGMCQAISRDTLGEETWSIVIPGTKLSSSGKHTRLPLLDWLLALDPNSHTLEETVELDYYHQEMKLYVTVGRIKATFLGIDSMEFPIIKEEMFAADIEEPKKPRGAKRDKAEVAYQKEIGRAHV